MVELRPKGITRAHLRAANIPEDYWECDFSNYLGPQSANTAAKKYLKNLATMKEQGNGMLLGGPPGPGKTTLALIVMKYLARAGWNCYCTSLSEIVENIQASWKDNDDDSEASNFLARCRVADFLLIDDLGKEHAGPTGFSANVFDNLVRHRVQHRLPTFITTNLNRTGIHTRYGDALLSLVEGKCIVVSVKDQDIRKTVLKPKLQRLATPAD